MKFSFAERYAKCLSLQHVEYAYAVHACTARAGVRVKVQSRQALNVIVVMLCAACKCIMQAMCILS